MSTETITEIFERYSQLSNGSKAEIRRCRTVDDLRDVAGTYQTLKSITNPSLRVLFLCPYLDLNEAGMKKLGALFSKYGIKEKRLRASLLTFENIRNLLKQCKPEHSKLPQVRPEALIQVFYWNKDNQKQIMRDFYTTSYSENEAE